MTEETFARLYQQSRDTAPTVLVRTSDLRQSMEEVTRLRQDVDAMQEIAREQRDMINATSSKFAVA